MDFEWGGEQNSVLGRPWKSQDITLWHCEDLSKTRRVEGSYSHSANATNISFFRHTQFFRLTSVRISAYANRSRPKFPGETHKAA